MPYDAPCAAAQHATRISGGLLSGVIAGLLAGWVVESAPCECGSMVLRYVGLLANTHRNSGLSGWGVTKILDTRGSGENNGRDMW